MTKPVKKTARNQLPAGPGRPKGVPNKTTALLKDAILKAAEQAGKALNPNEDDGLVTYLRLQARDNPGPFMSLLGKVLPMQLANAEGGDLKIVIENNYEK
jgi:hypothetical protein